MLVIELGAGLAAIVLAVAIVAPKRRSACFRTAGLAAFISLLAWLGLPPKAREASLPGAVQVVKR